MLCLWAERRNINKYVEASAESCSFEIGKISQKTIKSKVDGSRLMAWAFTRLG